MAPEPPYWSLLFAQLSLLLQIITKTLVSAWFNFSFILVNSQLICLPPGGVLNTVVFICITGIYFIVPEKFLLGSGQLSINHHHYYYYLLCKPKTFCGRVWIFSGNTHFESSLGASLVTACSLVRVFVPLLTLVSTWFPFQTTFLCWKNAILRLHITHDITLTMRCKEHLNLTNEVVR